MGAALGHCLVAYESTLKGLSRLEVNEAVIISDLMDRWEVLAEAVQTVMRRYGAEEPYEQLKKLTRGQQMDEALYREVLAGLDIPDSVRAELEALTPSAYTGLAGQLARQS
jgi:adenylosuccinate lyase